MAPDLIGKGEWEKVLYKLRLSYLSLLGKTNSPPERKMIARGKFMFFIMCISRMVCLKLGMQT